MSAFKSDHMIVRDYITAMDHLQYQNLPEGVVAITMTHSNLPTKHMDLRFDLHSSVAAMKERFRVHIGTPVEFQRLSLVRNGHTVCSMDDNSRMLGFYSVVSGDEIHIVDVDPYSLSRNGGLTDVSLVEKYRMSDDAYEQRKGSVREYIREQRKKDPTYKMKPVAGPGSEPARPKEIPTVESVAHVTVDSRCEVSPGGRRGVVRFVGEMGERGFWVGVQFDEPVGHNDGSVKGVSFFSCPMGYGAFVRGDKVQVGDFPERDPFADDDEAATSAPADPQQDEDEI